MNEFELVFTSGPLAGRSVPLGAEVVVGRENADLLLPDEEVSRRHAVFRPRADGVEVVDLGSLNGTFVNGSRMGGPVLVRPGDVVRVGTSELGVVRAAGPTSVRAQPPAPTVAGRRPAPAAPPPAPAQVPAQPVVQAPVPGTPFGRTPQAAPMRRRPATRTALPTFLAFATIIATAVALVAYFAAR